MHLTQPFTPAPSVRVMINIGALLDIPTGKYLLGKYGESILNGGLSVFTGIVGQGNNFKTTLLYYMLFRAMARIGGSGNTYDTEVNTHESRLVKFSENIEEFYHENIVEVTKRWILTDKNVYSGNAFYEVHKDFLKKKKDSFDKIAVETPFLDRDKKSLLKIARPTFSALDSFTEFETDDVSKMQDDNELGESGGNTIHMRQGLAKMRFLMEAPALNAGSYNYLAMTAHIGKESQMQNAGPAGQVPVTKLKYLKNGDKIKGVTDKFTFVTHNCWHCFNAGPYTNDSTKGPEYPRNPEDNLKFDTDLNSVQIRNLRGKSGPSGMPLTLIASQEEGVLPSLTEFHHIKECGRFGLDGNNIHYCLDLYPEVKLSRTTVRNKIDNDYKLRRALNITSEMCQMSYLWHSLPDGLLCPPRVLYEDIKALGYDWDMILSRTRGWWTVNNDKHPFLFLSTMDLLRMRLKLYHPYWLEDDKKTIKKEFIVEGK